MEKGTEQEHVLKKRFQGRKLRTQRYLIKQSEGQARQYGLEGFVSVFSLLPNATVKSPVFKREIQSRLRGLKPLYSKNAKRICESVVECDMNITKYLAIHSLLRWRAAVSTSPGALLTQERIDFVAI